MTQASKVCLVLAGLLAMLRPSPGGSQAAEPSESQVAAPVLAGDQCASPARVHVRVLGTARRDNKRFVEEGLDILAAHPSGWTDLAVTPEALEWLKNEGYNVTLIEAPPRSVPSYFHRYGQMLSILQGYANSYPEITKLIDIGDGWGKIYDDPDYPSYDIWALKISDNPDVDEPEPVILYTGVHHAREPATLEICLGIIDHLLSNYGTDPDVTRWVNEHETWVVPLVNPDGHWCCTDMDWTDWRKNARDNDNNGRPTAPFFWWYPDGVDLNRNYDWEWGGEGASHSQDSEVYCGPSPFSEPETQAMRDFQRTHLPVFTIDYHSYSELVLWPYGYSDYCEAPDDELLGEIATQIAYRIPAWGGGHYTPEQSNQLYPASGTSSDWEYGELNIFAYVVETCTSFYPGENELNHAIQGNIQGAMYLQERVDGPGIRGTVRVNGQPAEATITIIGLDDPPNNTPRHSHPTVGDYYRILAPGTYDIRYEVPGWDPYIAEDVVVPSNTHVTIDVDFGTSGTLEQAGARELRLYPTTLTAAQTLHLVLPEGIAARRLLLLDASGRLVADGTALLGGGRREIAWPLRTVLDGAPSGIYLLRLETASASISRRLLLLNR